MSVMNPASSRPQVGRMHMKIGSPFWRRGAERRFQRKGIDYRGIDTSGIRSRWNSPLPPLLPPPSSTAALSPISARLSFAALIISRAASRPASPPRRPTPLLPPRPSPPARRSNLIERGLGRRGSFRRWKNAEGRRAARLLSERSRLSKKRFCAHVTIHAANAVVDGHGKSGCELFGTIDRSFRPTDGI